MFEEKKKATPLSACMETPLSACMETTTSKTLNVKRGQNPCTANVADGCEDAMAESFSSLGLIDEHGSTDTNSVLAPRTQLLAANSVSDRNSIWGCCFFTYEGDDSGFGTRNNSVLNTDIFDHNIFSHEPRIIPSHHRFKETENNRPCSCNRHDIIINNNQPAEISLRHTLDILRGENCLQKECQIYALLGIVVKLMIDEKMHSIFQTLLDACDRKRMDSLVEMILWESESFLKAAFCKQGVYSITKLIRKLKKSKHAFTVTAIFSTKYLDLMTDNNAKQVIQMCFILFKHEPNEILYEATINYCHYLAMHKVGCRALNECISTISGQQRSRLLDSIAGISGIICDDSYGNYVLQYVMELNLRDVNARIFGSLRGKFTQLAQRKVGSHIVEKCMEISQTCLLSVMEEMLRSPQTPQVLAKDQFGNYVVQRALRMTREQGLIDLYYSLANSLRPHFPALMKTTGGRKVIDVIIK